MRYNTTSEVHRSKEKNSGGSKGGLPLIFNAPRVLHKLTQKKMAEDAESDIAICFVDEND